MNVGIDLSITHAFHEPLLRTQNALINYLFSCIKIGCKLVEHLLELNLIINIITNIDASLLVLLK